ncbi:MAG: cell envelope integrity protein TolA [Gammaproteobacteria bacterium]|nr:cell envelope integrity protein TolA [Gammaproteobacteria bacterium]MBU2058899.1 cell envelope integrity protein TolA [Gammaproteobacteria bacterium]MBU2177038.1 cell envelope integrity protein TolA [Gammaproteobacteria bacterium]MBU2247024.1 cell envelope integrity protein TolA [Gammaproteobacteria bacterium]MBU2342896.1 cell envelope integrity protein TolA [Gammaproteobacteria bacterium]
MEPAFKKSLIISGGLHLLVVVLLFANFNFFKSKEVLVIPMPGDLSAPLNATVIDQSQFDEMKEENQLKKKAEEKRLKDLERKKQQEERNKRLEEQRLKKQEQEKKQAEIAEKKAAEEKKKQAIEKEKQQKLAAEKKKKEEEQKKLQEIEKKKKEQAAKEKAAKEKAAKEKAEKAQAEKEKREREAAEEMLAEQLEEEANARRAAKAGQILTEKQRYLAMIVAKIQQNWFVDDTMRGKECRVNIRLASNGFVTASTILGGDRALCDSAMRAIQKAGNFPMSPDPDVYDALKDITTILQPELR